MADGRVRLQWATSTVWTYLDSVRRRVKVEQVEKQWLSGTIFYPDAVTGAIVRWQAGDEIFEEVVASRLNESRTMNLQTVERDCHSFKVKM